MDKTFFNEIITKEPVIFGGIIVLLVLALFVAFFLAYVEIKDDDAK